MLHDPSRFLLFVFEIGAAFQTRARVLVRLLQPTGKARAATRYDSIQVAALTALLHWRSCVDAWDPEQCE
jgi:hypothetical protein